MTLDFEIDHLLINAMIDAGRRGFELGGKTLEPVAIAKALPGALSNVTGLVGIAGRVNGSILVNMSEPVALSIASGMLMESYSVINDEVLDGLGEIANVIGGRLKSALANSGYPLDNITLPSVIVGSSYFITHSKGMLVFSVTFHVADDSIPSLNDRIVHVAMTLMTGKLERG